MKRDATHTQSSDRSRKPARRTTAAPPRTARARANRPAGIVTAEDNAPPAAGAVAPIAGTEDLRQRYRRAGELIRNVFRLPPDADAELVTRDAYLIVVSRIIQAITDPDDGEGDQAKHELSTADLVALSKALAEHRRLHTSQLEIERRFPDKARSAEATGQDATDPLPPSFRRAIEQIYGPDLDDTGRGHEAPCGKEPPAS